MRSDVNIIDYYSVYYNRLYYRLYRLLLPVGLESGLYQLLLALSVITLAYNYLCNCNLQWRIQDIYGGGVIC